jgi:predicted HNH restriction endonuclease
VGLAAAKKASFVRANGKLFCEQCRLDPVAAQGEYGDACIKVHRASTHVSDMAEGHQTRLEQLRCLCAICHRVEHRVLSRM